MHQKHPPAKIAFSSLPPVVSESVSPRDLLEITPPNSRNPSIKVVRAIILLICSCNALRRRSPIERNSRIVSRQFLATFTT
jgi:hypothetical protein